MEQSNHPTSAPGSSSYSNQFDEPAAANLPMSNLDGEVTRVQRDPAIAWPQKPLMRGALLLGGIVTFMGVASVIKPPPRSATAAPATSQQLVSPQQVWLSGQHGQMAQTTGHAPEHPKGLKCIGTLEGRDFTVHAYATAQGPVYSVFNRSGELLQQDLPADEVYRAFPQIDLKNLHLAPASSTPDGALMLAPTDPRD